MRPRSRELPAVLFSLWHASFNFVTASPNAGGLVATVTGALVMVWAIVIVWRCNWATLVSSPRSVRATREEKMRTLPGDERIPEAIDTLTHGATIRRAPRDVWPWLAQMGAGSRAGWYSYDWLDRLFGYLDRPSATRILPEFQALAVGDEIPLGRGPSWPVPSSNPVAHSCWICETWAASIGCGSSASTGLTRNEPDSCRAAAFARTQSGRGCSRMRSSLRDFS
jgi:hypothetical protein